MLSHPSMSATVAAAVRRASQHAQQPPPTPGLAGSNHSIQQSLPPMGAAALASPKRHVISTYMVFDDDSGGIRPMPVRDDGSGNRTNTTMMMMSQPQRSKVTTRLFNDDIGTLNPTIAQTQGAVVMRVAAPMNVPAQQRRGGGGGGAMMQQQPGQMQALPYAAVVSQQQAQLQERAQAFAQRAFNNGGMTPSRDTLDIPSPSMPTRTRTAIAGPSPLNRRPSWPEEMDPNSR